MSYRGFNILGSICVRGGSKGVKNKNLLKIDGKPLLIYSIENLKDSELFSYISVSSDSKEILDLAEKSGVDFRIERPAEYATDKAPKIPAIRHCFVESEKLAGKEFDILVDIDATSPLRNIEDIKKCVDLLIDKNHSNIITGSPSRRSPYFNMVEIVNNKVSLSKSVDKNYVRRQDVPKTFDMNASIYVWKRNIILKEEILFLKETGFYEMPEERSIDIDSPLDLEIVEFLLRKKNGKV